MATLARRCGARLRPRACARLCLSGAGTSTVADCVPAGTAGAPPATMTIDAAPRPRQVSPSGRFLAVLDSPRSILLVRFAAPVDFDSEASGDDAAGGREVRAGSKALVLGARFVIPSDSDLTSFGWMRCARVCARVGVCECAHRCLLLCARTHAHGRSCRGDVIADCGTGGLRVWQVAFWVLIAIIIIQFYYCYYFGRGERCLLCILTCLHIYTRTHMYIHVYTSL